MRSPHPGTVPTAPGTCETKEKKCRGPSLGRRQRVSVTATSVIHDWISADPPAHAISQTDIFPRNVYIKPAFRLCRQGVLGFFSQPSLFFLGRDTRGSSLVFVRSLYPQVGRRTPSTCLVLACHLDDSCWIDRIIAKAALRSGKPRHPWAPPRLIQPDTYWASDLLPAFIGIRRLSRTLCCGRTVVCFYYFTHHRVHLLTSLPCVHRSKAPIKTMTS